jgi:hypothetical protein
MILIPVAALIAQPVVLALWYEHPIAAQTFTELAFRRALLCPPCLDGLVDIRGMEADGASYLWFVDPVPLDLFLINLNHAALMWIQVHAYPLAFFSAFTILIAGVSLEKNRDFFTFPMILSRRLINPSAIFHE